MWLTILELTLLLGAAAGGFVLLQGLLGYWVALAITVGVVLAEAAGYVWLIMVPLWGGKTTGEVTLTKFHTWLLECHFGNAWNYWQEAMEADPKYRNLCYLGTVIWNVFHGMILLGLLGILVSPALGVGWLLWFFFRKPAIALSEFMSTTWYMIVCAWKYTRTFRVLVILGVLSLLISGATTYGNPSWFYTSLWVLGALLVLVSLVIHGVVYLMRLFDPFTERTMTEHLLLFGGAMLIVGLVAKASIHYLNTTMITYLTAVGSIYLIVMVLGSAYQGIIRLHDSRLEKRPKQKSSGKPKAPSTRVSIAGRAVQRYEKNRKQGICPRVSVINLSQ